MPANCRAGRLSADHPAMMTRKSTQRKLTELMMLTAMARKNLGPYFSCLPITPP